MNLPIYDERLSSFVVKVSVLKSPGGNRNNDLSAIGGRFVRRFVNIFPLIFQDRLDSFSWNIVPLSSQTIFADGFKRLVDKYAPTETALCENVRYRLPATNTERSANYQSLSLLHVSQLDPTLQLDMCSAPAIL